MGVGVEEYPLDMPSPFAIIPSEIRSPIPLPGGKVWLGDIGPHFLKEERGFFIARTTQSLHEMKCCAHDKEDEDAHRESCNVR